MNIFTILTGALQKVPPKVRYWMLVGFAVLVAGEFVAEEILGYDTAKADEILLYVGGYLGIQSAANVNTSPEDAVEDFYDLAKDKQVLLDPPPNVPGEHKA